jgi:NAD(P)-dependent dehydrogenase (short-subunit alcohol dehydrogenase family)
MDSSENKVAVITGATGAIGKAIALNIATNHDFHVHLIARDEMKAISAKDSILRATRNTAVDYHIVDLSRRAAIYEFADSWSGPVHVLVNNAAIAPRVRQENAEGIELQFATNVLGYFWMIKAFTDVLRQSAPSRIINVASYWAGGLDLEDLEFRRRHYDNDRAYRQSKQANRMLTVAFAEKLNAFNITVVSCHPGDVNSKLSNDLGFGGHESPDEGASTPVWLSTVELDALSTGTYYARGRMASCEFSKNRNSIHTLYEICNRYS